MKPLLLFIGCMLTYAYILTFLSVSCQNRLQECLQERAQLLQVQEAAIRQREKEKVEYKRAREAWDRRHTELENDIIRLREALKRSQEKIDEMKRKQKVTYRLMHIKDSI